MKLCTTCNQHKALEDFSIKRSSKDGRNSKCRECDKEAKKIYREQNKERYLISCKKYRENHRVLIRQRSKVTYLKHKEKYLEQSRIKRKDSPEGELLKGAKRRAVQKELPFDLLLEDIKIPENCPALGIPLLVGEGKASYNSPSLDRFIPSKGYVKGNVYIISLLANTIKSNATVEQVSLVLEWMKSKEDIPCGRN